MHVMAANLKYVTFLEPLNSDCDNNDASIHDAMTDTEHLEWCQVRRDRTDNMYDDHTFTKL